MSDIRIFGLPVILSQAVKPHDIKFVEPDVEVRETWDGRVYRMEVSVGEGKVLGTITNILS